MRISAGTVFGAVLALLHTGLFIGLLTVLLLAFAGGMTTALLVLGISSVTRSTSAGRLVLAGVAVFFVVMVSANMLIFLGDPRAAHTVVFWMLGGLGLAQWGQLIYPAVLLGCWGYGCCDRAAGLTR